MADDDLELRRHLAMRAFEKAYSNPRIRSGTAALYLSMMAMHGECGDIESLLHVYDLMVSAGVEPDEVWLRVPSVENHQQSGQHTPTTHRARSTWCSSTARIMGGTASMRRCSS